MVPPATELVTMVGSLLIVFSLVAASFADLQQDAEQALLQYMTKHAKYDGPKITSVPKDARAIAPDLAYEIEINVVS